MLCGLLVSSLVLRSQLERPIVFRVLLSFGLQLVMSMVFRVLQVVVWVATGNADGFSGVAINDSNVIGLVAHKYSAVRVFCNLGIGWFTD